MTQPNNPLHGITLEQIVKELEAFYGWEELARRITINCFRKDPSVKSSLKFLRKTPWARTKVEALYIAMQKRKGQSRKQNPPVRKSEGNAGVAPKKFSPWGNR